VFRRTDSPPSERQQEAKITLSTPYIQRVTKPLLDNTDNRPVHFVGIAGAGMSALAELFIRRGVTVTGCDMNPTGAADLERLGVRVTPHDPAHVDGARALVVTSAMPKNHPELERARQLGIPVIRRAEALGEVTVGRELVGIAGTHGKTTTTVMTTAALAAAGREPTALVGGRVAAWEGNLRQGGDTLYVVEADEYDRSFLALTPTVAVVTNIEADHLDIYADLNDIRGAFAQFARGARTIVLCGDDTGASTLPTPSSTEVIRYGIDSRDARLVASNVKNAGRGTSFDVVYDGEPLGAVTLQVPGRHNILNALAAIASGLSLGAPLAGLAAGLGDFGGVERRFQRLGEARGISVIDDYAHHPTEIAATLAAARSTFPGRRIVAAFQPHLYSRTRDFYTEFGSALSAADAIYLTEIYPAREQPIAGVDAGLIERAISNAGGKLAWRGERGMLAQALESHLTGGDVVITIGAGDITKTGPELLKRLGTA
jgi:UDP-N-acetylmuramate--alanine ligase